MCASHERFICECHGVLHLEFSKWIKCLIFQIKSAMSQFQTKVNHFEEKNGARLKNNYVLHMESDFCASVRSDSDDDCYWCGWDGQCAGTRGKSTKMIKVSTTDAKNWWRRSEYVFHLHFHVEGAAVGSNRVLMFEGQTEIFLFWSFQLQGWTCEQTQDRYVNLTHYYSRWLRVRFISPLFYKKYRPMFIHLLDEEISWPLTLFCAKWYLGS